MNTSPAGHLRRDPAPKIVVPTTRPTMAGKFSGAQVSAFAYELLKDSPNFEGFNTLDVEVQPHKDRVCAALKLKPTQADALWHIVEHISQGWIDAWGRLQLLGPRDTYTVWRTADGEYRSIEVHYAKG